MSDAASPAGSRCGRAAGFVRAAAGGWDEILVQHAGQDIAVFHQQELLAIQLDLDAGVFGEEHLVVHADFDLFVVADGDHQAGLRFFFGGLRDEDAGTGAGFLLQRLDQQGARRAVELRG